MLKVCAKHQTCSRALCSVYILINSSWRKSAFGATGNVPCLNSDAHTPIFPHHRSATTLFRKSTATTRLRLDSATLQPFAIQEAKSHWLCASNLLMQTVRKLLSARRRCCANNFALGRCCLPVFPRDWVTWDLLWRRRTCHCFFILFNTNIYDRFNKFNAHSSYVCVIAISDSDNRTKNHTSLRNFGCIRRTEFRQANIFFGRAQPISLWILCFPKAVCSRFVLERWRMPAMMRVVSESAVSLFRELQKLIIGRYAP